jgi:hypothetical protein
MKAKLIKKGDEYILNPSIVGHKLSKQNCDEIFGVTDVEKLADEYADVNGDYDGYYGHVGFKNGFNKAMELNKDKVFTLEDMKRAFSRGKDLTAKERFMFTEWEAFTKLVDSIQPTEIEVEIVMEEPLVAKSRQIHGEFVANEIVKSTIFPKPKLDSEWCLILKRVV